jgi:Family of unknown function (DUF6962)
MRSPITTLTNLVLLLVNLAFGLVLVFLHQTRVSYHQPMFLWWAAFFYLNTFATTNAIVSYEFVSIEVGWSIARLTIAMLGMGSVCFMIACADLCFGTAAVRPYLVLFAVIAAIYGAMTAWRYHFGIFVAFNATLAMATILMMLFAAPLSTAVLLILSSIGIFLGGGVVQFVGLKLPPLNHNDLYHLILLVGLCVAFSGMLQLG